MRKQRPRIRGHNKGPGPRRLSGRATAPEGKEHTMAHNVLLVCGSGASSGFMAVNIRKAAKKRGLDISVTARSEAEIANYIDDIDTIMVGPHLKYLVEEIQNKYADKNVTVFLMKPSYYSMLNGEAALDDLLKHFGE